MQNKDSILGKVKELAVLDATAFLLSGKMLSSCWIPIRYDDREVQSYYESQFIAYFNEMKVKNDR